MTAWQQLQDDAYDIGHRMHPAESPRAAASRLATERQLTGEPLAALRRIAAATERARYARPGSSGEPGVASDATLLRNTLREGVPRSTRWRAVILAPSTLRWASHLAGETVADVLDKVDEVFAVLGRQLRRI